MASVELRLLRKSSGNIAFSRAETLRCALPHWFFAQSPLGSWDSQFGKSFGELTPPRLMTVGVERLQDGSASNYGLPHPPTNSSVNFTSMSLNLRSLRLAGMYIQEFSPSGNSQLF